MVYLGSVNHYLVELDAGPTLTVLRQNLHGSTDQAMSRRGQPVTVGWADEHVIDLSGPNPLSEGEVMKRTTHARHRHGRARPRAGRLRDLVG